jgi:hypothetical protein
MRMENSYTETENLKYEKSYRYHESQKSSKISLNIFINKFLILCMNKYMYRFFLKLNYNIERRRYFLRLSIIKLKTTVHKL